MRQGTFFRRVRVTGLPVVGALLREAALELCDGPEAGSAGRWFAIASEQWFHVRLLVLVGFAR